MQHAKLLILKSTGRICYPFPMQSTQVGQIPRGYQRVFIPFTELEKRNSRGTGHIQVIRDSKLEAVKEKRLNLRA